MVVGRAQEASVLDGLLDETVAGPAAVVLEGEPGIGKTTLFNALVGNARDRCHTVLVCRPSRSEMDLSYVGLMELLSGLTDEQIDALPGPQARVLRIILRREEPDGSFDRLSLGVAMVTLVRTLARSRPVLIAIDDVQWLDHPSARTLAFMVRRLTGSAVRLALVRGEGGWSVHGGEKTTGVDWPAELGRAIPGQVTTVRLGPFDADDLSRILRRSLGRVPARPRLLRIAELSGGNPLYALELTRAAGDGRAGDGLNGALPDGVGDLARSRIAALPGNVREVVQLAAVPRAPTVELLSRLDPGALDTSDAIGAAVRAGVLSIDGDRLRFVHPIVAAAAYGSLGPQRRRALHRAIAILSDDLEERARHLAAATTGQDAQVAETLAAAAERAWRRGAPDAAADLLGLACRLTPDSDVQALALRRIGYARMLHGAGDLPGATAELQSLVDGLPAGPLRARALFHQMYITRLSGSLGRAMDQGLQAVAEAAGDPSFQAEVYELLSRLSDNDIPRKLALARDGLVAIDRLATADPHVVFHAQAALVEAEFYAGLGIHLDRLEGLDPGPRRRFPPVRTALRCEDLVGRLLTFAGRIDEGLAVLRAMYDRALVEGRSILPAILAWMAEGQIMAGRFAAAAELTAESIERSEENGSTGQPWELGWHAIALAMLGRLDEAEQVAGRVVAMAADDPAVGLDDPPARVALGLAAMARNQFAEAVTHLRHVEVFKQAAGMRDPRICAHAAEFVEALVGAGDLAGAAEVLDRFEDQATASAGQWPLAAAARCRALLLAAEGHPDGALAQAHRSLSLFEGLPMPFERARTLLVVGRLHRRRKEKRLSRDALSEALAAFDELGTPVWAQRVRSELARIPHRRTESESSTVDGPASAGRAGSGLTPTEQTIGALAAQGLTNREIGERTFLSPKTVEVNLTRIYRKLGVRSRAALASRFAHDHESWGKP
jgi:DNA-binding CsgD family transcriptional regulator